MAGHLKDQGGPRILLETFPEMPTSETIASFKRQTSLHDGRTDWTDIHPEVVQLLPDTVDYILHSSEIRCLDFQTLDGGTLRGVVGTFSFPASAPARNPSPAKIDS
jgi:hypothetical protein